MKNTKELLDALSSNWDQVISDTMDINKSKELSNIAGKMLKAVAVQMNYDIHKKYDKKIEFLEGESK